MFLRSIKLALVTTIAALLVGFPTAYFIATRPPESRSQWLLLITIPFLTNLLVRTFAIMGLLSNQGLVNNALIWSGVIDKPLQMLFTDGAVLAWLVYVDLPLMVLPIHASLERIDFRLVEAGYDLYVTRWNVLRHIVIPSCKPGLIAGSILVFIPAIGAYVTPRVLGGGKNMMMGNLIELQFGQGTNWPLGAALSITLLAIVTVALAMTRTAPYRGQTLAYALINQPLIVPEIVTAISLLIVFSAVKAATGYSGAGYLVLAHTAFCIPFAYLPIRARL